MATDTTNFTPDMNSADNEPNFDAVQLAQATPAGAPVQVQIPEGQNLVRVPVTAGETIILPFGADAVLAGKLGDNGNLAIKVGDVTVILEGYTAAEGQQPVVIETTEGKPIVLADVLSAGEGLDIQTAAGGDAAGAQGADNTGALFSEFGAGAGLGGFGAVGALDQTALNYKLIDTEAKFFLQGEGEPDTHPTPTNEVGQVDEDGKKHLHENPFDDKHGGLNTDPDQPGDEPDPAKISFKVVDFGPDGPAAVDALVGDDAGGTKPPCLDKNGNQVYSHGEPIVLVWNAAEGRLEGWVENSSECDNCPRLVFTATVETDGGVATGDICFKLLGPLDHPFNTDPDADGGEGGPVLTLADAAGDGDGTVGDGDGCCDPYAKWHEFEDNIVLDLHFLAKDSDDITATDIPVQVDVDDDSPAFLGHEYQCTGGFEIINDETPGVQCDANDVDVTFCFLTALAGQQVEPGESTVFDNFVCFFGFGALYGIDWEHVTAAEKQIKFGYGADGPLVHEICCDGGEGNDSAPAIQSEGNGFGYFDISGGDCIINCGAMLTNECGDVYFCGQDTGLTITVGDCDNTQTLCVLMEGKGNTIFGYAIDPQQPQTESLVGGGEGCKIPVFIITIDPDTGKLTYLQLHQINNDNPHDPDESTATCETQLEQLHLGIAITDYDHDSAWSPLTVTIQDDGPEVKCTTYVSQCDGGEGAGNVYTHDQGYVDEDWLHHGNEDKNPNPGDDIGGTKVHGSIDVDFGTDQPGKFGLTNLVVKDDKGCVVYETCGVHNLYTADGQQVCVEQCDGAIVGKVGDCVVFTLTLDECTGQFCFTQYQALSHPFTNDGDWCNGQETSWEDNLHFEFGVKASDCDGDSVCTTININVDDDSPIICDVCYFSENTEYQETSLVPGGPIISHQYGSVDEDWLSNGNHDTDTQPDNHNSPYGTDYNNNGDGPGGTCVFGQINAKVGADRPGEFSFSIPGLCESGDTAPSCYKTSDGQAITLVLCQEGCNWVVKGVYCNGEEEAFKVTLDSKTGCFKFELETALEHPNSNGKSFDNPWDDGVSGPYNPADRYEDDLTLSFGVKLTDADGDTVKTCLEFKVDDDAPQADGSTACVVECCCNDDNFTVDLSHLSATDQFGAAATVIPYAQGFGVGSDSDGGDNGRFDEINYTGNGTSAVGDDSEHMFAEFDGKVASSAHVDLNVFFGEEGAVGNEQGAYRLWLDGKAGEWVQFEANNESGEFGLDISSATGFDKIEFVATPGSVDPDGNQAGDSSDYAIEGIAVTLKACAQAEGCVDWSFGADGAACHDAVKLVAPKVDVTSGGECVKFTVSDDGTVVYGKLGDGTPVMELTLDPTTGKYHFYLFEQIDHGAPGSDTDTHLNIPFHFAVTDADGDTSTACINIDIKDTTPTAHDDSAVTTYDVQCNAYVTDGNVLANDEICADKPGKVTCVEFDGVKHTPDQDGNITVDGGTFKLVVHADGSYEFKQTGEVFTNEQHADKLHFDYCMSDYDGDESQASLCITLAPQIDAVDDAQCANEGGKDYNLLFIIDTSGSMAEDPDGPGGFANRLELIKASIASLLTSLQGLPGTDVHVQFVEFGGIDHNPQNGNYDAAATHSNDFTNLNDALTYLNSLTVRNNNEFTDYDHALEEAETETTVLDHPGINQVFFLSDGEPNRPNGDAGIDAGEEAAWNKFLSDHNATAEAIGVGAGVSTSSLGPIDSNNPVIVVDDGTDLLGAFGGAIGSVITGNVLTGLNNDPAGGGIDDLGVPTAHITKLTQGGDTFTSLTPVGGDVISNVGGVITIHTDLGGILIFNFNNGAYSYSAPEVNADQTEHFTYTIDNGFDTDTASLDICVDNILLPPSAKDLALKGNEDTKIDVNLVGTDPDGTIQKYILASGPAHGNLYTDAAMSVLAVVGTEYASNQLFYKGAQDYNGLDSFTYTVKDNDGLTDLTPATVSITVNSVNDAPVAHDDILIIRDSFNTDYTMNSAWFLRNDTDVDSALHISQVDRGGLDSPSSILNNPGDTFTIDPDGSDNFSYTASDGSKTSGAGVDVQEDSSGSFDGGASDEIIVGTGGNDTLNGNDGNDVLVGGGGTDTLNGGKGDDWLVYDGSDTFNGGSGTDAVLYGESDVNVDAGFVSRFSSIEVIDMTNSTNNDDIGDDNSNANSSNRINAQDVIDITDGGNTLYIAGDAGDEVWLNSGVWTQQPGTTTNNNNADNIPNGNYVEYTANAGTVHLFVDQDVTTHNG